MGCEINVFDKLPRTMYGSRLFKYIASAKLVVELVLEIPTNQLTEVFINFCFMDKLNNFSLEQRLNLIEKNKCEQPVSFMIQGCLDLSLSNFEHLSVDQTVKNKYKKHLTQIPNLLLSYQQRKTLSSL